MTGTVLWIKAGTAPPSAVSVTSQGIDSASPERRVVFGVAGLNGYDKVLIDALRRGKLKARFVIGLSESTDAVRFKKNHHMVLPSSRTCIEFSGRVVDAYGLRLVVAPVGQPTMHWSDAMSSAAA